jgi:hypothetical protein
VSMHLTYLESAEGETITKARALQELERHGFDTTPHGRTRQAQMVEEFLADLGDHDTYDAQAVLTWLGY